MGEGTKAIFSGVSNVQNAMSKVHLNCSILVPMRATRSYWRQKYCCANIINIFFVILISNFTFSADGYYEVQLMTKAVLRFDGVVIWQPPATYKGTPAKWIHKVAKKACYLKTPANKNAPLPYKIVLWKTYEKQPSATLLNPSIWSWRTSCNE